MLRHLAVLALTVSTIVACSSSVDPDAAATTSSTVAESTTSSSPDTTTADATTDPTTDPGGDPTTTEPAAPVTTAATPTTPAPSPTTTAPCRVVAVNQTVRRGDCGDTVVFIQERLTLLGFPVAADGRFGPGTELVVKNFQTSRGLTADGIVGDATWAALVEGGIGD